MIIKGTHSHGMKGAQRAFKRQKKIFAQLGLPGVETFYNGTINIDTSPQEYDIISFDYLYENIQHKSFPRKRIEDFGFIIIEQLRHSSEVYDNWGYLYFPHDSKHFTKRHVFELIGPELRNFKEGDLIEIRIIDNKLHRA